MGPSFSPSPSLCRSNTGVFVGVGEDGARFQSRGDDGANQVIGGGVAGRAHLRGKLDDIHALAVVIRDPGVGARGQEMFYDVNLSVHGGRVQRRGRAPARVSAPGEHRGDTRQGGVCVSGRGRRRVL